MTATTCPSCGASVADAYVCKRCASALAGALRTAAGHAEDAWTVIARQTRYGGAGGARAVEAEPVAVSPANRRNPVTAFGWAASVERPKAGALRPEPGPADSGAFDRLCAVENTITTWARDLGADVTGLAAAARWLAEHVDELRQHQAAGEAFDELTGACRQLERLVDRPADDRRLVGVCDCGTVLYARPGWTTIACKVTTCGATWNTGDGQDILMRHLDDRLVTASEAARLAAYLADGDRTQEQIRALITGWARRNLVLAHGQTWRDPTEAEQRADPPVLGPVAVPTYRFGEIRARLAQTPRRERKSEGAAA